MPKEAAYGFSGDLNAFFTLEILDGQCRLKIGVFNLKQLKNSFPLFVVELIAWGLVFIAVLESLSAALNIAITDPVNRATRQF